MQYLDIRRLERKLESLQSDFDDLESAVESAKEDLEAAKEKAAELQALVVGVDSDGSEHDLLADAQSDVTKAEEALAEAEKTFEDWQESAEGDELQNLKDIGDDLSTYRDESGIPESEFENYARELHEDINGSNDNWPYNCIDWERAAEQLKADYTTIDYDGNTYYVRA